MNKMELINALRDECQISKKEAAAVVDLFFNEMANALAKGDRVEIRGLCSFYVKNIKRMPGGIRKQVREFRWLPKNCHFSNAGRN